MSEDEIAQKKEGINPLIALLLAIAVLVGGGYYLMYMNKPAPAPDLKVETAKDVNSQPSSQNTTGINTAKSETPPVVVSETAKKDHIVAINMEAGSFYFKPDKISVKVGDTVKITFKAVDMMHNFYLDEFGIRGPDVKSGSTETLEFMADKSGTFQFYCNVGSHRAKGQTGTLTVE